MTLSYKEKVNQIFVLMLWNIFSVTRIGIQLARRGLYLIMPEQSKNIRDNACGVETSITTEVELLDPLHYVARELL
jgi:hypothetical protein